MFTLQLSQIMLEIPGRNNRPPRTPLHPPATGGRKGSTFDMGGLGGGVYFTANCCRVFKAASTWPLKFNIESNTYCTTPSLSMT